MHPGIVVADGTEEADQVRACGVAFRVRRTPNQLDQPVEGVLDVPTEQVEVGHHGLRVDVVGSFGGRGARPRCRSTPSVRLSRLAIARPAAASASAGLASTSFWYSATARVDVTALEGVLRRDVARVELLLAGLLVDHAAAGARLVPPGEAAGGQLLQHLGDRLAQLLERGERSGSAASAAPAPRARPAARTGSASPGRSGATASMSTRPSRNRPSNSPDSVCIASASCTLSGDRPGLSKASSTGAVRDPSSTSWKFCSLTRTA